MKTKTFLIILLAAGFLAGPWNEIHGQRRQKETAKSGTATPGRNSIRLFNGKDFSNWDFYLKDPSVAPETVFQIRNGIIFIKGDPFGYMRTKNSYSNYKLHVEYRWPTEATNSGIFIHSLLPDTTWPKNFECQLMAGNAGDLLCMNGASMNEKPANSVIVAKKAASSEKPVGEWNTVDITCQGNTIEVIVNGVYQNKGTGTSHSSGHICLQSEGKAIEFRNVFLTRLPGNKRR